MAWAVREGRLVTATLPSGCEVSGYVCGWDQYHWDLIDTELRHCLVHKSNPLVRIAATNTYDQDPQRDQMEDQGIRRFRRWVEEEFFGRHPESREDRAC